MKCREALKLLYEYLDKQLDDKTVRDVQGHLAECKHCFETYQFEEHLNNFVKQKSADDYSAAVDALKIKVMHRIEELGGPDELKERPPRFFVFKPAFAAGFLAAVSIIALIFYFSYANRDLQAKTFEPFLLNHEKALEGSIEMGTVADALAGFDTCLAGKLEHIIETNSASIDCHPIKGRVFPDPQNPGMCNTHLIYKLKDHDVSIFIMPIDCYEPPDNLANLENYEGIYCNHQKDYAFMVWSCKKYWYVAVSDVENGEFADFISLLR